MLFGLKTDHNHHDALDYRLITDLYFKLHQIDKIEYFFLRYTLLTAIRIGEVRLAKHQELDFDKSLCSLPAERVFLA